LALSYFCCEETWVSVSEAQTFSAWKSLYKVSLKDNSEKFGDLIE
jgi:hypothetical protein